MPLTIRSASIDDLSAILTIEQQAAGAAHWSAEEYGRLLKTGLVLVAEQAGTACGFICAKSLGEEWEIENVVVAAEFRRQGIGDRLMRALGEHAESGGLARVLLEVRESNQPARALYEGHGFREVGRRRNYYSNPFEDAILYERRTEGRKQP